MHCVVSEKFLYMQLSHIDLWNECLLFIKDNVSEEHFNTWIKPITPLEFRDNTLLVGIPSLFFYEYIEAKFVVLIKSALNKVVGANVKLKYSVVADATNNQTVQWDSASPAAIPLNKHKENLNQAPNPFNVQSPQDLDSQLNPKLTFDNFIEGMSNKLCRAAGLSVANDSTTAFNPLFIYGGSGVGKTHLVNAIGSKIKELYPNKRVLYISAHLFRVQYSDATRKNTINDFINFYQTIDVLIIDDVQEFASWKSTQNTFFHIFNYLQQSGKQIIMTCDKAPSELMGMEERLITRFKWGLTAEIERPNLELRKNILKSKIQRDGLDFSSDVIDYIAENVSGSVRELEGVVVSLMARSILLSKNIDVDLASHIIKNDTRRIEHKNLNIDSIMDAVCNYFNLDKTVIAKKSRKREYVQARQVIMYLSKKYLNVSLAQIGMRVAGKDHSTVIYSCNKVKDLMQVDKTFKSDIEEIELLLKN